MIKFTKINTILHKASKASGDGHCKPLLYPGNDRTSLAINKAPRKLIHKGDEEPEGHLHSSPPQTFLRGLKTLGRLVQFLQVPTAIESVQAHHMHTYNLMS